MARDIFGTVPVSRTKVRNRTST